MILILIAGASASGKTELARQLLDSLNDIDNGNKGNNVLLKMDDYYHEIPEGKDIEDYRQNTNFDTPEMFDFTLLLQHLNSLHDGKPITKTREFDFKINKRVGEETINPPDVLIIEGLFTLDFAKKHLNSTSIPKLTVFVETDFYRTIINRRISRDIRERGRHNKEEVVRQENLYVGPAFFSTICKSKNGVDISVDNSEIAGVGQAPSPKHPLMIGIEDIKALLATKQMELEKSPCSPGL